MTRSRTAALITAGLLAVIVLLLTIGFPSGALTSAIEARVSRATGYTVATNGASKVSLFPVFSVTLNDLTLTDPGAPSPDRRITIRSIRAELPLGSVLSGSPRVTELTLTQPVIRIPLIRTASQASAARPTPPAARNADDAAVEHITIHDGSVIMASTADGVEDRIDGINALVAIDAERRVTATGGAQFAGRAAKFDIKATAGSDAQPIPVELKFDAPDIVTGALAAKAEVRVRGSLLQINGLTGTLGDGAFNGWASVDLAGKPQLKLDLDFQRLALGYARKAPSPAGAPWSDARFDLRGLNYVDAQVRLSAAEFDYNSAHIAPASLDAKLANGTLTGQLSQLGIYGGEAAGQFTVDASQRVPSFALRTDFSNVRARPLLAAFTDFDRIDGKLQAQLALRASGDSVRGVMSTIGGTAAVKVRDGEIRGLNVPQMIRNLTTTTLSGWQDNGGEATDLTELSASFRIDQGKADTADLALAGPLVRMTGAGTVDLGAKMLALKVEPKLVLTTQGQSVQEPNSRVQNAPATAEPVGFGVPVTIDGPWASPRIYPDMAGMLDNPDAAYARLREMGKGLFGTGKAGSKGAEDTLGGGLGESIGRLIQQGLQNGAAPAPGQPPGAAQAPGRADTDATVNAIMKQLFGR